MACLYALERLSRRIGDCAMTDAELSRDLALALGYYPESVSVKWKHLHVYRWCARYQRNLWFRWDYRDPSVCLPLLDMLMREYGCDFGAGASDYIVWFNDGKNQVSHYDTLPEAVARAVIAVKGAK